MKTFLAALVLLVSIAPAYANNMRADAAYGVKYSTERVVQLPQDQNKPYLTVIGSESDPRFQVLKTWFNRHPTLGALKSETHYNTIAIENPHYSERLASSFPVTPCVAMQDANGNIVVEYAGNNLPLTADALATGLNRQATQAECFGLFRRHVPLNNNNNNVTPPLPGPAPNRHSHFPWVLLVILVAVAAGAGVAKEWYDLYYKNKR